MIVRKGWNRLSIVYRPPGQRSDAFRHTEIDYRSWLAPILDALPAGARVLELGCGTGEPASREIASRFELTGIDISEVMIRRARAAVPHARFRRADMTKVTFAPGSFDAVVSLYAMIHVPVVKQRALLTRIRSWLTPQGFLLVIVGHGSYQGVNTNWLDSGVAMYWSHADAATFRRWLREIGFTVLRQEFVPEGDGGHELFLARKRRKGISKRELRSMETGSGPRMAAVSRWGARSGADHEGALDLRRHAGAPVSARVRGA